MTKEDDLLQLVNAQEAAHAIVLNGATSALRAPLSTFRGWYDHSAIRELTKLLARLLAGYEVAATRNADAYMTSALAVTTGRKHPTAGTRRTPIGRMGVTTEQVLGRIANEYRYQQSQIDQGFVKGVNSGKFLIADGTTPLGAAENRLGRIVSTNLQMAQRAQMQTTMNSTGSVIGYRRIIHPELAEEGTCGLCIAASDRLYHKGTLLPIHPGCHCTHLPVTKTFDPHSINELDFGKLYNDAGGTSAEQLRATRYRIDQHGEIGPVLRPEDEPIRKPRSNNSRHKSALDQLETLTRRRDQLAAALQKAEIIDSDDDAFLAVLKQQRLRIDALDAEIAELRR